MSIPIPFSVTVEDAVARMVNMDYIPEGFTLIEMTAAFLEEAEVEHHNAIVNFLPADKIAALQIRMDACKARHSLAQSLTEALRDEIGNPEGQIVKVSDDSNTEQHITFESLTSWASDFGIGSLGWAYSDAVIANLPDGLKPQLPDGDITNCSSNQSSTKNQIEPWFVPNPKDKNLPPLQNWYTPARYFARKLVVDDPTLLTKRPLLAKKVVQSLTAVGIFKRGGIKPLDPGTVLKAFSNVILG